MCCLRARILIEIVSIFSRKLPFTAPKSSGGQMLSVNGKRVGDEPRARPQYIKIESFKDPVGIPPNSCLANPNPEQRPSMSNGRQLFFRFRELFLYSWWLE
jgi:hypothetical protein